MKKKTGSDVPRETVVGPVLAMINVNSRVVKKSFGQGRDKQDYFACPKTVDGGVFEVYVFGDTEPGKAVAALVEIKNKMVDGCLIHYGKAEVENGAKPRYRLYVGSPSDRNVRLDPTMPELNMKEHGREFRIGFIKI